MVFVRKEGDWQRAGALLHCLSAKLYPAFEAKLMEDGNLVLKTILHHIDAQDLPWKPLAKHTIELKGGSETIYVETGFLRDNLSVRKIKSSKTDMTIFVGASPWKKTPEGVKFSDLMIWLEYGTDKMPARPLIRPSWEEVKPTLKKGWQELLTKMIKEGARV